MSETDFGKISSISVRAVPCVMYPNYLAGLYFPQGNKYGFINIATTDSNTAVRLTSFGDILGGGIDGSHVGGDIALGMVPVLGVWTDVRDAVINLGRMFPGGQAPEWNVFAFSVLGIFTEVFPPADWAMDVIKNGFKIASAAAANSRFVAVSFEA